MEMKNSAQRKIQQDNISGYLFILPFIIGFVCFISLPMVMSLILSFTKYDILTDPVFSGFTNYTTMFFHDKLFWKSFGVTIFYVLFSVPARLIMALLIAMLLVKTSRLSGVYRTIFYLPSVIGSSVAVAILWRRMFASDGVINGILQSMGFDCSLPWLGRTDTAIWTLILLAVWQFGSSMLIFLAALKQIPRYIYEAAKVDGARSLTQFFKITLPLLTPSIFFNLINQLINGFMAFTQSYIITEGKPQNSTLFYVVHMYLNSFKYGKLGYGCAMAWIMIIVVGGLTALLFWSQKKWVYYESER